MKNKFALFVSMASVCAFCLVADAQGLKDILRFAPKLEEQVGKKVAASQSLNAARFFATTDAFVVAVKNLHPIAKGSELKIPTGEVIGTIRVNPTTQLPVEVYIPTKDVVIVGVPSDFVVVNPLGEVSSSVISAKEASNWLKTEYTDTKELLKDLSNIYENNKSIVRFNPDSETWVNVFPVPVNGIKVTYMGEDGRIRSAVLNDEDVIIAQDGVTVRHSDGTLSVLSQEEAEKIDFVSETNLYLANHPMIEVKKQADTQFWLKSFYTNQQDLVRDIRSYCEAKGYSGNEEISDALYRVFRMPVVGYEIPVDGKIIYQPVGRAPEVLYNVRYTAVYFPEKGTGQLMTRTLIDSFLDQRAYEMQYKDK